MNETQAITNLNGNSVATDIIAKWEEEIDIEIARHNII